MTCKPHTHARCGIGKHTLKGRGCGRQCRMEGSPASKCDAGVSPGRAHLAPCTLTRDPRKRKRAGRAVVLNTSGRHPLGSAPGTRDPGACEVPEPAQPCSGRADAGPADSTGTRADTGPVSCRAGARGRVCHPAARQSEHAGCLNKGRGSGGLCPRVPPKRARAHKRAHAKSTRASA